jgi:hypothetical protein
MLLQQQHKDKKTMKVFDNLANYIQNLNKKDFEKYLSLILLGITLLGFITVYQIYNKSSRLITQIKNTEKLAQKSISTVLEYDKLQQKETQLQELLKQNREFDIRVFFEQFSKEQNMIPEPNWTPIELPVEGNENFDEVVLTAAFKKQTTEKLVNMLDALEKKEKNIYIKELVIRNNLDKTIDFEISLATMRYKRIL